MIDFLYSVDLAVFYFINHTLSNSFFDKIFPYLTEVKHWFLVYIIFWLMLFFKGGKKGRFIALGIILLVIVSDQFSSTFLKNIFERIRPCNALTDVKLLVGSTGSFSFPSSHAVNNFAGAVYLSRFYPNLKYIFYSIAFLMAFSRPYVGVHYPSDVFGGAVIGIFIGYLISVFIDKIFSIYERRQKNEHKV